MSDNFYYTANLTNCTKQERDYFKSKSCLITISVAQSPHEDEKFKITLNSVNNYFKYCLIAVNDTLQRHTLSLYHPEKSEAELFEYSYRLGSEWIERNEKIMKEELQIPYKVKRWDSWFGNERYFHDIKTVNELYQTHSDYQKIVDNVVETFVDRLKDKIDNIDCKKASDVSRTYLLEECAAMLQWFYEEELYDYELYPSIRNNAISETFKLVEREKEKLLLRPLGIKFKRHEGTRPVIGLDQLAMDNLIKILPGHVYWKNTHGSFVGCNLLQAKGFGFKKIKSIIGKSDFDILDYDIAMRIRENDITVMESGSTHVVEEATVVGGSKSVYISNKSPIKDSNGTVVGVLGVSIDITEQKKLGEQLRQKTHELEKALAVKTEFLNNLSHEIRTPVAGFSMAADNLMCCWDNLSEKQKFDMVKVIAKSADRIKNLSMHLLDALKLRDGQRVFNIQKLNLTKLIYDFIDEAASLYTKEKNISITFNENRGIYVEADYEAIGQVFRNIVINAIKYSPNNSSIVIKITPDHQQVKVEVSDEGIGIAENELEAIFNQFYQSTRTKTGAGGIGLGLNITKQIIEAHGGKVWAVNNEDKGCRLIFTLRSSDTHTSEKFDKGNNKKILIIDDDELILSSLALSLISHGFQVDAASSGREGIDTLEECSAFDFIVLDIMMPEMNGFEVLKIIKAKWPHLKVVIHSGLANTAEIRTAEDLGAYKFIKKPYKTQELLASFS